MKSFIFVAIFSFCLCSVASAKTDIQDVTTNQRQTATYDTQNTLPKESREAWLQRRANSKNARHSARTQERKAAFERMKNWKFRANKQPAKNSD